MHPKSGAIKSAVHYVFCREICISHQNEKAGKARGISELSVKSIRSESTLFANCWLHSFVDEICESTGWEINRYRGRLFLPFALIPFIFNRGCNSGDLEIVFIFYCFLFFVTSSDCYKDDFKTHFQRFLIVVGGIKALPRITDLKQLNVFNLYIKLKKKNTKL